MAADASFGKPREMTPSAAPSTLSDEDLVQRVCAGEVAMFEHLMRRHNPRVYRAARAILRDDSEAEDVMQDTFVRAYEHLPQFAGRALFSTWLTRIAVNEALARVRRSRRSTPLESHMEEPSSVAHPDSNPEQQLSDVEMRSVL